MTASTVGYGDIAPVTIWGRLVAMALMFAGIGLFSTLAAAVAAHFVEQDRGGDIQDIKERLDRIEALLLVVAIPAAAAAVGAPGAATDGTSAAREAAPSGDPAPLMGS